MKTISRFIIDNNNNTIHIKGVSKSGLEYLGLDLNAIIPETIDFDIQKMKEWKINTVRIPLRDIHWLFNQQYKDKLDLFINKFTDTGFNIILDLHTQGENPGQDLFILKILGFQFWSLLSKYYKNRSNIFFELFNEPHDISPDVWWYGNDIFCGYKEILLEIRKNANNICILGGLDYAYQWNFLNFNQNIMNELRSFKNIVLAVHPYGYRGSPANNGQISNQIPYTIRYPSGNSYGDCSTGYAVPTVDKKDYGWDESFGFLGKTFPIIATEFGLDQVDKSLQGGWYINDLLEYFNTHDINYIAWAWVQERLNYPSLLDPNFNPTGSTAQYPQGPACAVKENNYYPGPGQIVYNDLNNKTHRNLSLKLINKSETELIYNYPELPEISFIGFFFILGLFILYNISFTKKKKSIKINSVSSRMNLFLTV